MRRVRLFDRLLTLLYFYVKIEIMVHSSIGREAQRIGATAEQRVITELGSSGWSTKTSSELDYGKKIDVLTTCPEGQEFAVQISVSDKSSRERKNLAKRGVTPLPVRELNRSGISSSEFLCSHCPSREGCRANAAATLGASALTAHDIVQPRISQK